MKIAKQYLIACVFTLCMSLSAHTPDDIKQQAYGQALYERICDIIDDTDSSTSVQAIIADEAIYKILMVGKKEGYTAAELLEFAKRTAQKNEDQEAVQVLQEVEQEVSKSWFSKHPIMMLAFAAGALYTYLRWDSLSTLFANCLESLGLKAVRSEVQRTAEQEAQRLAAEEAQRVEAARVAAEQEKQRLAEELKQKEETAAQKAKEEVEKLKLAAEQEAARLAEAVKRKEQEDADFWSKAFKTEQEKEKAQKEKQIKFESLIAAEAQKAGLTPEQQAELERLAAEKREEIIAHFTEVTQELKEAEAQTQKVVENIVQKIIAKIKEEAHQIKEMVENKLHLNPGHEAQDALTVKAKHNKEKRKSQGKPKRSVDDVREAREEWHAEHADEQEQKEQEEVARLAAEKTEFVKRKEQEDADFWSKAFKAEQEKDDKLKQELKAIWADFPFPHGPTKEVATDENLGANEEPDMQADAVQAALEKLGQESTPEEPSEEEKSIPMSEALAESIAAELEAENEAQTNQALATEVATEQKSEVTEKETFIREVTDTERVTSTRDVNEVEKAELAAHLNAVIEESSVIAEALDPNNFI